MRVVIALLCVVVILIPAGCRSDMASSEQGSASSARKVLIAGEATEFKRNVVEKVVGVLGTKEHYFRTVGLGQLKDEGTGQWGAIVLVTAMMAGEISPKVTGFLEEDPTDPRVIVLMTRGTDDPLPEGKGPDLHVDVVSSASKNERADEVAGKLAALISARF